MNFRHLQKLSVFCNYNTLYRATRLSSPSHLHHRRAPEVTDSSQCAPKTFHPKSPAEPQSSEQCSSTKNACYSSLAPRRPLPATRKQSSGTKNASKLMRSSKGSMKNVRGFKTKSEKLLEKSEMRKNEKIVFGTPKTPTRTRIAKHSEEIKLKKILSSIIRNHDKKYDSYTERSEKLYLLDAQNVVTTTNNISQENMRPKRGITVGCPARKIRAFEDPLLTSRRFYTTKKPSNPNRPSGSSKSPPSTPPRSKSRVWPPEKKRRGPKPPAKDPEEPMVARNICPEPPCIDDPPGLPYFYRRVYVQGEDGESKREEMQRVYFIYPDKIVKIENVSKSKKTPEYGPVKYAPPQLIKQKTGLTFKNPVEVEYVKEVLTKSVEKISEAEYLKSLTKTPHKQLEEEYYQKSPSNIRSLTKDNIGKSSSNEQDITIEYKKKISTKSITELTKEKSKNTEKPLPKHDDQRYEQNAVVNAASDYNLDIHEDNIELAIPEKELYKEEQIKVEEESTNSRQDKEAFYLRTIDCDLEYCEKVSKELEAKFNMEETPFDEELEQKKKEVEKEVYEFQRRKSRASVKPQITLTSKHIENEQEKQSISKQPWEMSLYEFGNKIFSKLYSSPKAAEYKNAHEINDNVEFPEAPDAKENDNYNTEFSESELEVAEPNKFNKDKVEKIYTFPSSVKNKTSRQSSEQDLVDDFIKYERKYKALEEHLKMYEGSSSQKQFEESFAKTFLEAKSITSPFGESGKTPPHFTNRELLDKESTRNVSETHMEPKKTTSLPIGFRNDDNINETKDLSVDEELPKAVKSNIVLSASNTNENLPSINLESYPIPLSMSSENKNKNTPCEMKASEHTPTRLSSMELKKKSEKKKVVKFPQKNSNSGGTGSAQTLKTNKPLGIVHLSLQKPSTEESSKEEPEKPKINLKKFGRFEKYEKLTPAKSKLSLGTLTVSLKPPTKQKLDVDSKLHKTQKLCKEERIPNIKASRGTLTFTMNPLNKEIQEDVSELSKIEKLCKRARQLPEVIEYPLKKEDISDSRKIDKLCNEELSPLSDEIESRGTLTVLLSPLKKLTDDVTENKMDKLYKEVMRLPKAAKKEVQDEISDVKKIDKLCNENAEASLGTLTFTLNPFQNLIEDEITESKMNKLYKEVMETSQETKSHLSKEIQDEISDSKKINELCKEELSPLSNEIESRATLTVLLNPLKKQVNEIQENDPKLKNMEELCSNIPPLLSDTKESRGTLTIVMNPKQIQDGISELDKIEKVYKESSKFSEVMKYSLDKEVQDEIHDTKKIDKLCNEEQSPLSDDIQSRGKLTVLLHPLKKEENDELNDLSKIEKICKEELMALQSRQILESELNKEPCQQDRIKSNFSKYVEESATNQNVNKTLLKNTTKENIPKLSTKQLEDTTEKISDKPKKILNVIDRIWSQVALEAKKTMAELEKTQKNSTVVNKKQIFIDAQTEHLNSIKELKSKAAKQLEDNYRATKDVLKVKKTDLKSKYIEIKKSDPIAQSEAMTNMINQSAARKNSSPVLPVSARPSSDLISNTRQVQSTPKLKSLQKTASYSSCGGSNDCKNKKDPFGRCKPDPYKMKQKKMCPRTQPVDLRCNMKADDCESCKSSKSVTCPSAKKETTTCVKDICDNINSEPKRRPISCPPACPSSGGRKKKRKKSPCGESESAMSCSPKKDPCEEDPCKKKSTSSCKKKKSKSSCCKKKDPCKKDPCKKKSTSSCNPCKKKDPCKKKSTSSCSPCKKKDPCKKNSTSSCCSAKKKPLSCKKKDPCKKKSTSSCKKKDPCKKKSTSSCSPCKKKSTSSCKKKDPCKKKSTSSCSPCKKKDPCKKKSTSSCSPCKKKSASSCKKKPDPCDPCQNPNPCKKEDPCKKRSASPCSPCKKKKSDPCAKQKKDAFNYICKKKDKDADKDSFDKLCRKQVESCQPKSSCPGKPVKKEKFDPCKGTGAPRKTAVKKGVRHCKGNRLGPQKSRSPCKRDPCKKSKKKSVCDPCAKFKKKKKKSTCDPCNQDPCKPKKKKKPCSPCKPKKKKKPCSPCKPKPKPCNPCKPKKKKKPCSPCKPAPCDPCKKKKKKPSPCSPCKKKKKPSPCSPCKKKSKCKKPSLMDRLKSMCRGPTDKNKISDQEDPCKIPKNKQTKSKTSICSKKSIPSPCSKPAAKPAEKPKIAKKQSQLKLAPPTCKSESKSESPCKPSKCIPASKCKSTGKVDKKKSGASLAPPTCKSESKSESPCKPSKCIPASKCKSTGKVDKKKSGTTLAPPTCKDSTAGESKCKKSQDAQKKSQLSPPSCKKSSSDSPCKSSSKSSCCSGGSKPVKKDSGGKCKKSAGKKCSNPCLSQSRKGAENSKTGKRWQCDKVPSCNKVEPAAAAAKKIPKSNLPQPICAKSKASARCGCQPTKPKKPTSVLPGSPPVCSEIVISAPKNDGPCKPKPPQSSSPCDKHPPSPCSPCKKKKETKGKGSQTKLPSPKCKNKTKSSKSDLKAGASTSNTKMCEIKSKPSLSCTCHPSAKFPPDLPPKKLIYEKRLTMFQKMQKCKSDPNMYTRQDVCRCQTPYQPPKIFKVQSYRFTVIGPRVTKDCFDKVCRRKCAEEKLPCQSDHIVCNDLMGCIHAKPREVTEDYIEKVEEEIEMKQCIAHHAMKKIAEAPPKVEEQTPKYLQIMKRMQGHHTNSTGRYETYKPSRCPPGTASCCSPKPKSCDRGR